jgi:hypothetical protein
VSLAGSQAEAVPLDQAPPASLERARLIVAVRDWVREYGSPPRVIDWDPALARLRAKPELAERFESSGRWPRFTTVRREFGGMGDLVTAAGYPPRNRRPNRGRREWTTGEILAAIRRWERLYGEPPTTADWDPYRARAASQTWRIERYDAGEWPSAKSVRNRFGRFSEAIATAGLTPRRQGQRLTDRQPPVDVATQLHVASMRGLADRRQPHQRLADAVKRVSALRTSGEPTDLRVALVEVAAAAMAWADRTG